jgi:hypothetical protein
MKVIHIIALIVVIALSSCASHKGPEWLGKATQSHRWGYYSGLPETRWNSDGRSMTLLNELRYTDPNGIVWIAPAGSEVDGASIPRSLWSFMGGPFEGKYRNASVLHDVAYDQHNRPWEDCDRMFYHAMRCSGVGAVEAGTMYYALYKFGRHWKVPIKKAKALSKKERKAMAQQQQQSDEEQQQSFPRAIPVNQADVNATRDWIRNSEPSLEQIEQRANAEPH